MHISTRTQFSPLYRSDSFSPDGTVLNQLFHLYKTQSHEHLHCWCSLSISLDSSSDSILPFKYQPTVKLHILSTLSFAKRGLYALWFHHVFCLNKFVRIFLLDCSQPISRRSIMLFAYSIPLRSCCHFITFDWKDIESVPSRKSRLFL